MQASLLILIGLTYDIVYVVASAPCSSQSSAPYYELIHQTDSTTELTGSITLTCRDSCTAEELEISEIKFFLNHSLALKERGDIRVVEIGTTSINFNLTHRLEGNFTCGKSGVGTANNTVRASLPKTLVCK